MTKECITFGLRLRSDLEVPGAHPAGTEMRDATTTRPRPIDLRVVPGRASSPEPEDAAPKTDGPYSLHGSTLTFRAAAVATYQFDLRQSLLTVEPEHASEAEAVSALLIATALPAALWMRGDVMLHAAAAVLPGSGRAIAFAAPSGFGKSRLLASLLAGGCSVLAEDSLCLRLQHGVPMASGLPGCIFERPPGAPLDARLCVPVPLERQRLSAPLGALLVLDPRAGALPQRITGTDALAAILASFHRPRVPRLIGRMPGLLPALAHLLQTLAVYRWAPPLDQDGFALAGLLGTQLD